MKLFIKTRNSEMVDLKSTISFGRVEGDLIFSKDDMVSGRHGKFVVEGDKAFILDTGSTNGTFLNNGKLERNVKTPLKEGDSIRFGSQIVIFTTQNVDSGAQEVEAPETLEPQRPKTGQELLAQARKNKESKAQEIEQKHKTAIATLKKLTDDLADIAAKVTLAEQAIEEIDKRIQEATTEAARLEIDKDNIRKSIEDKKKPAYSKQATLQDKLKLLDLAQAPDDQKAPLFEELKKVEEQLKQLENEKNSLPTIITDLQNKAETLAAKRLEYVAQLEKLTQALSERQNKYAPDIERLEDEMRSLDSSLTKAKEILNK